MVTARHTKSNEGRWPPFRVARPRPSAKALPRLAGRIRAVYFHVPGGGCKAGALTIHSCEDPDVTMTPPRFARCFQLANLLQSRFGHSIRDLAETLGVHKRTIYRDLHLLREAGVPVSFDPLRGGQVTAPQFRLPSAGLTDEELLVLLLAARTSHLADYQEFASPLNQSISKILRQLPDRVREEAISLLKSCLIEPPQVVQEAPNRNIHQSILAAIRKKCQLRISFQPRNQPELSQQTKIAPYRLIASQNRWVLIGRSSYHRGVYRFDLQRIQWVEVTDDSYELPARYRNPSTLKWPFEEAIG